MLSIDTVILYCLKQLNGERTIYSIFHLLKGKKSSQTLQDAHLYGLTKYFGIYQSLTRDDLNNVIKRAVVHQLVSPGGEDQYLITEFGEKLLKESGFPAGYLPYLNGLEYHQRDTQFWERISLLIQVASNLMKHETRYVPIQKNKQTQYWLKTFLNKNLVSRELLGRVLYSELVDCFEGNTHVNPGVFTLRLTGYKRIGLTPHQAAEKLKMDLLQYQLEFFNILHYLIQQLTLYPTRFPILSSILENQKPNQTLTKSAQATFDLIKKGYSIEEISLSRNLKTSTIEDHIVEIALNIDEFSIGKYVDNQLEQKILSAVQTTNTRKLKEIRSEVSNVNYFEIRLVLAKNGVKQWN